MAAAVQKQQATVVVRSPAVAPASKRDRLERLAAEVRAHPSFRLVLATGTVTFDACITKQAGHYTVSVAELRCAVCCPPAQHPQLTIRCATRICFLLLQQCMQLAFNILEDADFASDEAAEAAIQETQRFVRGSEHAFCLVQLPISHSARFQRWQHEALTAAEAAAAIKINSAIGQPSSTASDGPAASKMRAAVTAAAPAPPAAAAEGHQPASAQPMRRQRLTIIPVVPQSPTNSSATDSALSAVGYAGVMESVYSSLTADRRQRVRDHYAAAEAKAHDTPAVIRLLVDVLAGGPAADGSSIADMVAEGAISASSVLHARALLQRLPSLAAMAGLATELGTEGAMHEILETTPLDASEAEELFELLG